MTVIETTETIEMAKRTKSSGDDGGPAPKIGLALADDGVRCQRLIRRNDGTEEQCSRFSLKTADGGREAYCLGHSDSENATKIRKRGALARHAADDAAREHRQWLTDHFAGEPWERPEDVRLARFLLGRMLLLGEATVPEVRELRALVDAAERSMLYAPGQFHVPAN